MNFLSEINKAFLLRKKLSETTNAMRIVNGAGDGLDGLLIDRYDKHFHVQCLSRSWDKYVPKLHLLLGDIMPVDYLIVKIRRGLDIKAEVMTGSDPRAIVEEYGVKFRVNLNDGLNCGLFLDMRRNRRMVGEACRDAKVLIGFAYTCSFGVHARLGGTREVINTDISRKILEQGKHNYQLNGLSPGPGEFIKSNSVSFLQRAFKKGNCFDVIILDPPSFARHEDGVFQVKNDLPKLMALAVAVLSPGGSLFVSTNYSAMTHADLERILSKGLNGRQVAHLQRVGQDEDFPGSNSFKESYMVGLWVKFH